MNAQEFMLEVDMANARSKRVLLKKEKEYAVDQDRLEQFYILSVLNKVEPTEALWGMASKHITSIADMVKCPDLYKLKTWREKVTDLRNYTLLLDALLVDLEIE
jgi:hypothetical protein